MHALHAVSTWQSLHSQGVIIGGHDIGRLHILAASRSYNIYTCIALTCALACSFRGDPFSRPRWASRMGALSWGLDLANFEGVPVRLHGFEMENVSMLWSAFVAQIFRQVRVRSLSNAVCQCPM